MVNPLGTKLLVHVGVFKKVGGHSKIYMDDLTLMLNRGGNSYEIHIYIHILFYENYLYVRIYNFFGNLSIRMV